MNLTPADAKLFFDLFFGLLAYTNRELHIVPEIVTAGDLRKVKSQKIFDLRNALYAHSDLIARYVAENPEHLSADELSIVASWQHHLSGDFYLVRYLKKYAVFLSTKKAEHLYGVLALYDPLDVIVQGQPPPVLLETTLLPFKGQIIYDGLVNRYSIFFGAGIRRDINATYRRLKETEGIIEQLVDSKGKPHALTSRKKRDTKPVPDWKPVLDEIVAQTDKMKRADTAEQSAVLGVLRAAARLAHASYSDASDESASLDAELKQVRRALTRLENMLFVQDF